MTLDSWWVMTTEVYLSLTSTTSAALLWLCPMSSPRWAIVSAVDIAMRNGNLTYIYPYVLTTVNSEIGTQGSTIRIASATNKLSDYVFSFNKKTQVLGLEWNVYTATISGVVCHVLISPKQEIGDNVVLVDNSFYEIDKINDPYYLYVNVTAISGGSVNFTANTYMYGMSATSNLTGNLVNETTDYIYRA